MSIIMHLSLGHNPIGHFRVPLCLCFKRNSRAFENDCDLHENEPAEGESIFT